MRRSKTDEAKRSTKPLRIRKETIRDLLNPSRRGGRNDDVRGGGSGGGAASGSIGGQAPPIRW